MSWFLGNIGILLGKNPPLGQLCLAAPSCTSLGLALVHVQRQRLPILGPQVRRGGRRSFSTTLLRVHPSNSGSTCSGPGAGKPWQTQQSLVLGVSTLCSTKRKQHGQVPRARGGTVEVLLAEGWSERQAAPAYELKEMEQSCIAIRACVGSLRGFRQAPVNLPADV